MGLYNGRIYSRNVCYGGGGKVAAKLRNKRYPKCHKKYYWSPDTKHKRCPHCGGTGAEIPGNPIFDAVRVEDVEPDVTWLRRL